jgi:hypothetical protein
MTENEVFIKGLQIGRYLTLLNPGYTSITKEGCMVIMNEKGESVKTFSGDSFMQDCSIWLRDRLHSLEINYHIDATKIKTSSFIKAEEILNHLIEMGKD